MNRAAAGAAAVFALAALCSGCGGPTPTAWRGSPVSVVRASADRTLAASTATVDVTLAQNTAGTGVSGTGSVDFATQQAVLSLGRTGSAAARDDHFVVVVDGGSDFVMADSPLGGGMPGTSPGRPWLAGTPAQVAATGHDRIAPLDTLIVRPGAGTALALLRGAVDALVYGGQEIRGEGTLRVSVHIDLERAARASPADERPALLEAAAAIGPVLWPADVWIDPRGRVARLEIAEDPELHTTTTRGNLFITDDGNPLALTDLDFFDFGVPAKISVPARGQVVEAQ
jgi:hypothetical protein